MGLAILESSYKDGIAILGSSYQEDIGLIWDQDSMNIDPNVFTIENGETDEPTIYLKARITTSDYGSGWIHWFFGLTGMAGKRPVFEIETTGRTNSQTYLSTWRPVCSDDRDSWTHSTDAFTALTSPYRVRFQFHEAFSADTVYVADQIPHKMSDFHALGSQLATDSSGMVYPSSAATSGGIIGVSPAETDDLGRSVGVHNMYGFVLKSSNQTTDGYNKRWAIVDCGIHSGEVLDGWPLRGMIDYYLNGTGTNADRLRANWNIGIYFCLTPNGRYGGHRRTNFRDGKDPNRDWGDAGAFSLAESVIVRDAVLADLDGLIPNVGISLHTDSGGGSTERIYRSTLISDSTAQNAFLAALDSVDGTNWARIDTAITSSVTGWHAARGTEVCIIPEFGTRTSATKTRYAQTGQRFLEAISEADSLSVFSVTAPTLAAMFIVDNDSPTVGQTVTATDASVGDDLTLSWLLAPPAGSSISTLSGNGSTFAFTPDVAGDYTLALTANDGTATDSAQQTITAEPGGIVRQDLRLEIRTELEQVQALALSVASETATVQDAAVTVATEQTTSAAIRLSVATLLASLSDLELSIESVVSSVTRQDVQLSIATELAALQDLRLTIAEMTDVLTKIFVIPTRYKTFRVPTRH